MTREDPTSPGKNAPLAKDLSAKSSDSQDEKNQSSKPVAPKASAISKGAENEEPELLLEPDLPSDGRDEIGETLIRELPQRPELSEPPSQPKPSSTS